MVDLVKHHGPAYDEWKKNPMTQRIQKIAMAMARPVATKPSDPPHRDSYHLGEHVGYHALMDVVFNADEIVASQKQAQELAQRVKPRYGAPGDEK